MGLDVNGRATIFDVAETAGVSITTVSHVFSGNRRVGAGTRERVERVARDLGYRPRATAQALAHGRTNTLALQLSISGESLVLNPFLTSLLASLSLSAIDRGFSFVYVPPGTPARRASSSHCSTRAGSTRPSWSTPCERTRSSRRWSSGHSPTCRSGGSWAATSDYWVDNDHRAVCEKVVAHLTSAGYVRPALLTVPFEVSYVVDYTRGFHAAAGDEAPIVDRRRPDRSRGAESCSGDPGFQRPAGRFLLHPRPARGRGSARRGRGRHRGARESRRGRNRRQARVAYQSRPDVGAGVSRAGGGGRRWAARRGAARSGERRFPFSSTRSSFGASRPGATADATVVAGRSARLLPSPPKALCVEEAT